MNKIKSYTGIILGAIYGLIIRFLSDNGEMNDLYNIYSITFIWVTPVIIGLFPILFSSNALYQSKVKLFFYPFLTVLLFMALTLATGLEDLLCLLIIGLPFGFIAGIVGILLGIFVKKKVENKSLYSLLFIPLLLNPIENLFPNQVETFSVQSEVIIQHSNAKIFPYLLAVPTLDENVYQSGFYQAIGIPRPMYAELYQDGKNWYRIGYFTDQLSLYEYVSEIKKNEFVNFKIDLQQSQLRNTPTDQHLLKSDEFKFENINYTLVPIDAEQTKIILNCDYTLNSKLNGYANFWAERIIKDFEVRLLEALKLKLESEILNSSYNN